jgi:uncharacterized membrane protein (DUF4010 family)
LAGLHSLSLLVGFSDIDPFILALLAGKYSIDIHIIATAVLMATASNNILKAIYTLGIARNRNVFAAAAWLVFTGFASITYTYINQ